MVSGARRELGQRASVPKQVWEMVRGSKQVEKLNHMRSANNVYEFG